MQHGLGELLHRDVRVHVVLAPVGDLSEGDRLLRAVLQAAEAADAVGADVRLAALNDIR